MDDVTQVVIYLLNACRQKDETIRKLNEQLAALQKDQKTK